MVYRWTLTELLNVTYNQIFVGSYFFFFNFGVFVLVFGGTEIKLCKRFKILLLLKGVNLLGNIIVLFLGSLISNSLYNYPARSTTIENEMTSVH